MVLDLMLLTLALPAKTAPAASKSYCRSNVLGTLC